jgi:hypothetical protein
VLQFTWCEAPKTGVQRTGTLRDSFWNGFAAAVSGNAGLRLVECHAADGGIGYGFEIRQ